MLMSPTMLREYDARAIHYDKLDRAARHRGWQPWRPRCVSLRAVFASIRARRKTRDR